MRPKRNNTLALAALALLSLLVPAQASAWTSAKLAGVDVSLAVAPRGASQVTTQARFEVQGGKFHGFSLAPIPGAELIASECRASTDEGKELPLLYRPLDDGRVRVLFEGDKALEYGAVTYTLVHRIDLVAQGALRRGDGRARLDWSPLVWDAGTDVMTVDVLLPGESASSPPTAVPSVTEDYEVSAAAASVRLTKFRSVRWYSMRVAIDFDASLVPGLRADSRTDGPSAVASTAAAPDLVSASSLKTSPPLSVSLAPFFATLMGFALMVLKAARTRRTVRDMGLEARFLLLAKGDASFRFVLSILALALGLAAQCAGSIAAGIPAFAAAVCLWTVRREPGIIAMRASGSWREMSEEDVTRYKRLCREYTARRTCPIDISHARGALAFAVVCTVLGAVFLATYATWPRIALATLLDSAIWIVPAFFTHNRAQLPVDPTLESFVALKSWRRALNRLIGSRLGGATAAFFVREDENGPIEVRLRVEQPLPAGVFGIEVANELIRVGTQIRRRSAVVLRLEPGSEIARRLAALPSAAEHHLAPDLKTEVLVLRNRRGKRPDGLAPLRAALSRIAC